MRVMICGAGLAGLSTALFLHRTGHEPILIERAPELRGEGYMIDFIGSGLDVCERAGLWAAIERIHYPIARIVVVDTAGRERYSVAYETLRDRVFHGRHFNFLRGDLERVLYEQVRDHVEIRFGVTIDRFQDLGSEVVVELSDGRSLTVDVLVGSDGVRSRVRELLFGGGDSCWRSLGMHTAAFVMPSRPAAIQGQDFSTLTVPGRQVSVYPIQGNRLATFFLHHADGPAPRDHAAKLAELRRVYAGLDWVIPDLLAACGDVSDLYYDEVAQIELPKWSSGRVVLVGDACDCVSLVAGQGASLAIAGGYVLARELAAAGGNLPAALDRYAVRLQGGVARKQRAGRKTAGWFLPKGRTKLAMRDLAMRMATTRIGGWALRRQIAADSLPLE